nr:uncharacterized protein LOC117849098 [Setaria viridis]
MEYWENEVRRFMLEEEEEDDELFLVMVPALQQCLYEEKRPEHSSTLSGVKKVVQILEGHENWCKVEFRMEPEIFRVIANYLRVENLLCDTRGVRVEEQLGMFMFMLSHNASIDRLKKEFQHSGETIHRKITEFFDIIPALTHRFLKLPNVNHTHVKIASDPRFMPFFQNCVGAIDGTHVPITIAQERAAPYRNRKGTLSQNVMITTNVKFRKKPFPLYNNLELLYEESIEVQSAPASRNLEDQNVTGGKKCKQSQMAAKLRDYIDFRKDQIEKTLEKLEEKKRREEDYSIEKCIDIVDAMEELSDEQKLSASSAACAHFT